MRTDRIFPPVGHPLAELRTLTERFDRLDVPGGLAVVLPTRPENPLALACDAKKLMLREEAGGVSGG